MAARKAKMRIGPESSDLEGGYAELAAPVVSASSEGITVFGELEPACVATIDRIADQMLMPRSWVVSQILREWFEKRMGLEKPPLGGESWDDSIREILGRHGMDEDHLTDRDRRRRVPA
jgi:hypothetical protein